MKNKKLAFMALFIAFSFIGGNIKIMGTVAFDSMPAFLGSLVLGPMYGAVIGAVGHLLDAVTSGFPLTLPVHVIIMICMAGVMYIFSLTQSFLEQRTSFGIANMAALTIAAILNGPVECLLVSPIIGLGAAIGTMPVLTLVSIINIFLAQVVYRALPKFIKEYHKEIKN
ncbi:ECF transporter S component [Clostridium oryzae]|uniref:ECF transporter S component n=1 Tax=Clostridium oryzae TaxID=1450648 RepID=A0A1V4ICS6_9CLOT|nr:ECF transporter S component [Clostridium oryzae]OPJ57317.1 hypothetical protein CLORY_41850 [Clostridium oryzae]